LDLLFNADSKRHAATTATNNAYDVSMPRKPDRCRRNYNGSGSVGSSPAR
jgi:hypothetical protein